MKKLFSLLLALCMLLLAVPSLGETAADAQAAIVPDLSQTAINGSLHLSLDQDAFSALVAANGAPAELVSGILSLVNNLGINFVVNNGFQLSLSLKEQPVATVAALNGEKGLNIVSDLFPSYVLTVAPETLQQAVQSASSSVSGLSNVDMEAVAQAVMTHLNPVLEEINSRIGEPTATNFVYGDVTFTQEKPINFTAKELALLVMNLVKNLSSDPALEPVLSQIQGLDLSKLDEQIAELEARPDDQFPTTDLKLYQNEAGSALFVGDVADANQSLHVAIGTLDSLFLVDIDGGEAARFTLRVDQAQGKLDFELTGNGNGAPLHALLSLQMAEQGLTGILNLEMNGAPFAALDFAFSQGGEITATFDPAEKTELALESLMSDTSGEAAQPLLNDIMSNGLSAVLTAAMSAMPDEVGALMNSMSAPAQ